MPRVLDIVQYPDAEGSELVHRVPETGSGDFRLGSQLIVRESQAAVFFKDGKALDLFRPGRYTLTTANIPLLINALGLLFQGRSPFTAEMYFVNTRKFLDMKWGTSQPISLRDSELGVVRLRAFGTYSMQVVSPRMFVGTITGARGLYQTSDIQDFLRGIILTRLTDLLGTTLTTIYDLPQAFDELSVALKEKAKDDFTNLGISIQGMYLESISPTEDIQKAIDERAAMGAVGNLQAYLQFKAAQALGDAAQQTGEAGGGLTGAGVGLGAGMGLAGALAGAMGQAFTPQQAHGQPGAAAPAGAAVACPTCQAQNPASAHFCLNCGARISGESACPACHAAVPAGAQFCPACGAKMESSGEEPTG